jgi:transposase
MSVYVGIDVHRKRSQVAVVTEDGQVQLNKNVVNGSEPFLRLIGDLPSGTPVAFEAAFGWSWLADLLKAYEPAYRSLIFPRVRLAPTS